MPVETSLIVIEQETPLADSREIAQQLGVEHESFFTLIKRYQEEIEMDFGLIRFEIGVKMGPQRGKRPLSNIDFLRKSRRQGHKNLLR